ncbi:TIGR01777 family protein [Pajaroellobacter abortibovis]|uniref:TIGR01777 family protein n=2 Tax=Pajaroellobacter abortibovis TaxID=1882918 RepID=A0A1L6MY84_9BACT|nr:TIGR01777 family protein [Pajaroellobacter abortibovis]
MTGATGFIGRSLLARLRRDGHHVCAWVRNVQRAKELLGSEAQLIPAAGGMQALQDAIAPCKGVIHLAGEPILGERWTDARRKALVESRVGLTHQLVEAMSGMPSTSSRAFVCASATGVYGDRGDECLSEESKAGNDFLAQLCQDWEKEARRVSSHGIRSVQVRIGIVLGQGGGVLDRILPLFRAGLGGWIRNGKQYWPWIHLNDLIELFVTALTDERYEGPIHGTSPNPVTNRTWTQALGKVLRRPIVLPLPAVTLKMALGEGATVLLRSQRVLPVKAQALGFQFQYPSLDVALAHILDISSVHIQSIPSQQDTSQENHPKSSYLKKHPPSYLLNTSCRLNKKVEEAYHFFSTPDNLGFLTPSKFHFHIQETHTVMGQGTEIHYRLRLGPIPLRWRTKIEIWQPGRCFVDSQQQGPYSCWWHEHYFDTEGGLTVMKDKIYYAPPFGWLGRIIHWLLIAPALREIFSYRAHMIQLRFGVSHKS